MFVSWVSYCEPGWRQADHLLGKFVYQCRWYRIMYRTIRNFQYWSAYLPGNEYFCEASNLVSIMENLIDHEFEHWNRDIRNADRHLFERHTNLYHYRWIRKSNHCNHNYGSPNYLPPLHRSIPHHNNATPLHCSGYNNLCWHDNNERWRHKILRGRFWHVDHGFYDLQGKPSQIVYLILCKFWLSSIYGWCVVAVD